jgi:hypothetical protein
MSSSTVPQPACGRIWNSPRRVVVAAVAVVGILRGLRVGRLGLASWRSVDSVRAAMSAICRCRPDSTPSLPEPVSMIVAACVSWVLVSVNDPHPSRVRTVSSSGTSPTVKPPPGTVQGEVEGGIHQQPDPDHRHQRRCQHQRQQHDRELLHHNSPSFVRVSAGGCRARTAAADDRCHRRARRSRTR